MHMVIGGLSGLGWLRVSGWGFGVLALHEGSGFKTLERFNTGSIQVLQLEGSTTLYIGLWDKGSASVLL